MATDAMRNLDRFMETYQHELTRAVEDHPEEYGWPASRAPEVAARMRAAIERGTYNHEGRAFRTTCRALGIGHTRRAIAEFLAGDA